MAERKADSLLQRLRANEKVLCNKCQKGYFTSYNIPADKALYFGCSNEECDNHINIDPMINLE